MHNNDNGTVHEPWTVPWWPLSWQRLWLLLSASSLATDMVPCRIMVVLSTCHGCGHVVHGDVVVAVVGCGYDPVQYNDTVHEP